MAAVWCPIKVGNSFPLKKKIVSCDSNLFKVITEILVLLNYQQSALAEGQGPFGNDFLAINVDVKSLNLG